MITIKRWSTQVREVKNCCTKQETKECEWNHCFCVRKLLLNQLESKTKQLKPNVFYVTLYCGMFFTKQNKLHELDLRYFKKVLKSKCKLAGITKACGGVDFQYLYFPNKGEGLWQPHIHFHCQWDGTGKELFDALIPLFPPHPFGKRPVHVQEADMDKFNASYMLKEPSTMFLRIWKDDAMSRGKTKLNRKVVKEMNNYQQLFGLRDWLWVME